MPIQTLVGLIIGNLIWSAHPVMGKLVLADFTPAEGAWLRYTSALLSFVVAVAMLRAFPRRGRPQLAFVFRPSSRWEWIMGVGLGFLTFCFSPLLQMSGLSASRATDNALIVAMEPLMTVFLAWAFLRERLTWIHLATFAAAIGGFAMLADLTPARLALGWDAHSIGNLVILLSLSGEAAYSVLGRKLVQRHPAIGVFGFALASGVLFLTVGTIAMQGALPLDAFSRAGWKSAAAILWLGPFGTTASYLFWMLALRSASVASVALTLFIQPVCGALWGYLFLGERLSVVQFVGGATILLAVFAQTLIQLPRRPVVVPS